MWGTCQTATPVSHWLGLTRGVGTGLGFGFAQTKAFKQFEQEQHLGLGFAPGAGDWRLEVMRQLQHAHNAAIKEVRVFGLTPLNRRCGRVSPRTCTTALRAGPDL